MFLSVTERCNPQALRDDAGPITRSDERPDLCHHPVLSFGFAFDNRRNTRRIFILRLARFSG